MVKTAQKTQTLQNPLIKDFTLNDIRIPNKLEVLFLHYEILGGLEPYLSLWAVWLGVEGPILEGAGDLVSWL